MIFVEDNTIKLNGVVLPGLVKSIEVKESAQIDEQEVEGSSAKPKQATGYEDAKINIELVVDDTDTQTKYQRLETLRGSAKRVSVCRSRSLSCVRTRPPTVSTRSCSNLSTTRPNRRRAISP